MAADKKQFLIIDANSVIHRAYHALPPLTTKKGELVNAVYGFLLAFLKAIKDFQPDYIAAAFDFPAPTFRHKKFKEYKAKRPPTPKELYQQIPRIKEILESFNVPIFEKQGFEADDIVGTLALQAAKFFQKESMETIIASGDLDILQLVDKNTKVYHLKKGVKNTVLYDEGLVKERLQGLSPVQFLDFKALRGDPSDNIPGVAGIGEKTGQELLLKFGSLENIYKEIEETKVSSSPLADAREVEGNSEKAKNLKPKLKEILLKYKKQAFLSKMLAEIIRDVPIDFSFKKCQWQGYNKQAASRILESLEFYSLVKKLPELETKGKINKTIEKTEDSSQKTLF